MKFKYLMMSAALVTSSFAATTPAKAGLDEYLGELMLVGYTFCPRGSFDAAGQLLPISQWNALFALYGTQYGGDGRTTFGLPDLRGRTVIGQGNGPGLTPRTNGQKGGQERVTLSVNELAAHNHVAQIQTTGKLADTQNPRGDAFGAVANATDGFVDNEAPSGKFMHPASILVNNAGSSQSHQNMQPFTVMRYCVVNSGVFPSRN